MSPYYRGLPVWLAEHRKAIVATAGTALGSVALVVTGNETLADVTTAEWIAVAASVVGVPTFVAWVPNRQPRGPAIDPPGEGGGDVEPFGTRIG